MALDLIKAKINIDAEFDPNDDETAMVLMVISLKHLINSITGQSRIQDN